MVRVRPVAVAVVLVVLASACSGAGDGVDGIGTSLSRQSTSSSIASSTTTAAMPEPPSRGLPDLIVSDPAAIALAKAAADKPSLGTLIAASEAEAAHQCVTAGMLKAFGAERLGEIVDIPGSPAVDTEAMDAAERELLARTASQCDPDGDRVKRVIAIGDPHMAACLTDRILAVDKATQLMTDLIDGVDVRASALVAGFRYGCQAETLDVLFGEHPGGTAGEDLRLVSEALADWAYAEDNLDAFERTCLVRGVMDSIEQQWAWDVLSQTSGQRMHPVDYLIERTDPTIAGSTIAGINAALFICVDQFKLLSALHSDLRGLAPGEVGCLRSQLGTLDLWEIARAIEDSGVARDPDEVSQSAYEKFAEAVLACALAPLPERDLISWQQQPLLA